MTSAVCGWCGVHANMPMRGDPASHWTDRETGESRVMAAHQCDSCNGIVLSYSLVLEDEVTALNLFEDPTPMHEHRIAVRENRLSWYPPAKSKVELTHVPFKVESAAKEAWLCFEFGALRASVQLARSVVEATAKNKGITVGGIYPKIEAMFTQGLIREYVKDAAHAVRVLGNELAHGDFTQPVSKEEARLVLTLMNEVLTEVYEGPGKVADARAQQAARAQGTTSAPGTT